MDPYLILFAALIFLLLAMAIGYTWDAVSNGSLDVNFSWRTYNKVQKVATVVFGVVLTVGALILLAFALGI